MASNHMQFRRTSEDDLTPSLGGKWKRKKRWRSVLLIVAAFLLLAEGALRLAGLLYERSYWMGFEESMAAQPSIRVLALGESTTGGVWLSREEAYPAQFEQLLKAHYITADISVIVPLHIGQNTSQMRTRAERYARVFRPRLVVLMCGANNSWSLAESSVSSYVSWTSRGGWRIKLRAFADRIRVLKALRVLRFRLSEGVSRLRDDLEGQPELAQWPPSDDLMPDFGRELLLAWRDDMLSMIHIFKNAGASVVLMTYPAYKWPPIEEFERLAAEEALPLVRNDLTFAELTARGVADEYMFSDDLHPNTRGYGLLARNLFDKVRSSGILERMGHAHLETVR